MYQFGLSGFFHSGLMIISVVVILVVVGILVVIVILIVIGILIVIVRRLSLSPNGKSPKARTGISPNC